ncbi:MULTISPECIES: urea ABC transporter permease subunit UrtB [unclassified Nocardioides]|uniref:urea ABC transporter permease subunit UrtB n=1 Tax=unclassified Nocardioides TaxID=2615069 RepID=UPI001E5F87A4|nr:MULTISPECIES: urea ABC transporter permease subunit UrtB [unclassified Nocardioides]MCD4524823.1 urea ABC transporter permease subunit UrtB [Nocardioides sp. cx-173]MCD4536059.1 urea ABC transporter permease subunit UrtB [Nocardioides sp. cx-169]UGB43329.1 urea ABC transporter permease subunit UrtB [Nocardioides sp. cx-173]
MDVVISQLFTGASTGAALLLIALGLSLTFGQMGVINMAHGEFLMAGAYTAYLTQQVVPNADISLLLAIPAAFVVAGLLGVLLEASVIQWMYHRPLDTLLVTFGVSLVLQQLAKDIFGAQAVAVEAPSWLHGQIPILGYRYPLSQLFILVLAVACLVGVAALLRYTRLGRQIRATVQSRDLAETVGVSTRRIDRLTFFLGSGLAGIAGVAVTRITATESTMGSEYIIWAFLVVVAGGIGQIKGAVIAAFAIGITRSFLTYFTDGSMAVVLTFLIVVVFLQLRPQGLFAVRTRSLV